MRTMSTAAAVALSVGDRASWFRVQIYDGASWVNLSDHVGIDWLIGAEIGERVDGRSADAVITVFTLDDLTSISPLCVSSRANSPYVVLALDNHVQIDLAVTATGVYPGAAEWVRVFNGRIVEVQVGAQQTTVQCVDESTVLARKRVNDEITIGDGATNVETVMQQVLTTYAPGYTLYTPNGTGGTPLAPGDLIGWLISPYQQRREPVFDALRALADSVGYEVRYRWHPGTSDIQLQFYTPDPTVTTPNYTFTDDDYFDISTCGVSIRDVRNHITVGYKKQSGVRDSYIAQDATSIGKHGEIRAELHEGDTSPISTIAEATRLATNVLAATKDPIAAVEMSLPMFPWVELHDLYRLGANGVHLDSAIDIACIGYRHFLGNDACTTTLSLRGKPSIAAERWLEGQQQWPKKVYDSANNNADNFTRNSLCPNGDLSQWGGF